MSDSWQERANIRREFRQSKDDPEVPKHKKWKKNGKKPWVIRGDFNGLGGWLEPEEDRVIRRYKNEAGAKSALAALRTNTTSHLYENLRIEYEE